MFKLGKDKEKRSTCSCCDISPENICQITSEILVLGGGCSKCHELEANTKEALNELGIDRTVNLVTDPSVIAAYGVMTTPALVVDEKIVSYGKVLKTDEIKMILEEELK